MSEALGNKRNKDVAMAKRLAEIDPSEKAWARRNPAHHWPYHSNLGTRHTKPTGEKEKGKSSRQLAPFRSKLNQKRNWHQEEPA